jgi:hypothetical protein
MTVVLPTPTTDFAVPTQAPSLDEVTVVRLATWVFYNGTVSRFDVSTQETLGAYLQRSELDEEDLFSQRAAKSLPRSWRDL